ncbi:MAG: hypothetical protein VB012_05735 [Erysipelotrichaceae bacterium]|nr:hypothetical protein [Erysipelotrichaceae bacterium]
MSRKLKYGAIIMIILLVITALSEFMNHGSEEVVDLNQISCYEYIIETMSQPQYWGKDQHLEYSTQQLQAEAEEQMPEATGWMLDDADQAIFKRGYEGVLRINFSKKQAYGTVQETFDHYRVRNYLLYDFAESRMYRVFESESGDEYIDLTVAENEHISADNKVRFNAYQEIYQTMLDYDEIFNQAGCPLYGKESGTLRSYQNQLTITTDIKQESDGLIHAPWEQANGESSVFSHPDITLLKSADEAWHVKIADLSQASIMIKGLDGDTYQEHIYNPYFVIYTRSSFQDHYQLKDPYLSPYFEQLSSYQDKLPDFMMNYVNVICKEIYQAGCVYAVDIDNMPDIDQKTSDYFYRMTFEQYQQSRPIDDNTAVVFYHQPKSTIAGRIFIDDINDEMLYQLAAYLDMVMNHYGKKAVFSDDYIKNFGIYYNLDRQRLLGLR